MKRILFTLCIMFIVVSCSDFLQDQTIKEEKYDLLEMKNLKICSSDTVLNVNDATKVALMERYGSNSTKGCNNSLVKEVITISDSAGDPVMYAINFVDGGYIIVSATKRFFPILVRAEYGSFSVDVNNTGESILLAEFKDNIEIAKSLPEDSLRAIKILWEKYEENEVADPVCTKTSDMASLIMSYISQWQAQGLEYHFLSEGNVFNYLPNNEYERFVQVAQNSANPNYEYMDYSVIIKYRNDTRSVKGPLITTAWHQRDPYNKLLKQYILNLDVSAGCSTIAAGQIMRYYQYPEGSWNWPSIVSNNPDSLAKFVFDVYKGIECYTNLHSGASPANIEDVRDYLIHCGYNAQQVAHSTGYAKASLYLNRPVYMRGHNNSSGHAWVCDGYVDEQTEITYRLLVLSCADPVMYESVTSDYVYTIGSTSFFMNWGNGYISSLYTTTGGLSDWLDSDSQFKYDRKDLIHIYPLN